MTAITLDVIRAAAEIEGVCVRPIVSHLHDVETGKKRLVPIPCGSTREAQCPPCADKARKLRMQQCREGWHLDTEPDPPEHDEDDGYGEDAEDQADDADGGSERRVRSTRRRQDAPDLPSYEVEARTVGQVFTTDGGKTYRPSMFATMTLPSYGRVRSDGTPVDPGSYDYRQAALDAMHFPKLVDRFWQNLRRAVGYRVQYFAAVEPQRRLAPHLHAAIRGAIPRVVMRQVIAGTYHQVWWPAFDEPVYDDEELPGWDHSAGGYVDPDTGELLPTWEQALDRLDTDPDARPGHVVRFGEQTDLQGILAGTSQADRRVGYLCKYLNKSIADTHPDEEPSARRSAHVDRLWEQARWLPCSPRCGNWLRYGVQPKDARPTLEPGRCRGKAHRRDTLGCGGRRVLVSRQWTGKTLTQHRADRAAVVRAVLEEAGIEAPDVDRYSTKVTTADGRPRFVWTAVRAHEVPAYRELLLDLLKERQRWRGQYEDAKQRAGPPGRDLSATEEAAEEVAA
ncbi:MAG: replication initiation protein [Streptosporangiales bacterium]|nr:replication initiation protein [Streptosporangiales bacterium]